jgi:CRISPR-associated protein Csc2
VQSVYDLLGAPEKLLEHPFNTEELTTAVKSAIAPWTNKRGISMRLSEEELTELILDVDRHWSLDDQETFLKRLDESYASFRKPRSEDVGKKGKGKKDASSVSL